MASKYNDGYKQGWNESMAEFAGYLYDLLLCEKEYTITQGDIEWFISSRSKK